MKKLSILSLTAVLTACAANHAELNSQQTVFLKQAASLETEPPSEFWRAYKLPELDLAMDKLEVANLELKQAAIHFKLANITVDAASERMDLSAQGAAGYNWQLRGENKPRQSYSASVGTSYELDLWRKLSDQTDAAKARAAASQFDYLALLQVKRRALINHYFDWSLNQDQLLIVNANLARRQQLVTLSRAQYQLGKTSIDQYHHHQSQLLQLENQRRKLELQNRQYQSALADLLNIDTISKLPISPKAIIDIADAKLDLAAPLYLIGRRPDLQSAASTARAYNLELDRHYKNWFPQLSLSAGLNAAAEAIKEIGSNPTAALGLSLKLPFLNYARLKRERQQSQLHAQNAMLAFSAKFNNAMLEASTRAAQLKQAHADFANSEAIYQHAKAELSRQLSRFAAGKIALADKLLAEIDCANSLSELQNAKRAYLNAQLEMLMTLG